MIEEQERFTLVRRLGSGGTGEVHEGLLHIADGPDRRVAIKILAETPYDEPGRVKHLVDQCRNFGHPNIVAPLEFVASSAGRVVISDWIDGISLVEFIRRLRRTGRSLPSNVALDIVGQVLEGLIYLHSKGGSTSPLVHRHIKPSNIMLGSDGHARLIDIGLETPQTDPPARTKGVAVLNLLPYMAPEQLVDTPNIKYSPATDLYCLGTVAYELLAGRALFDGPAARRELEIRVGFGVADKLRALDSMVAGISSVLSRALALLPGDRYASALEMIRALQPYRRETQLRHLAAMVVEMQALPEIPTSPQRTGEMSKSEVAAVGAEAALPKLSLPLPVARVVEPLPHHLIPKSNPARDARMKVGIALLSVCVAVGALVWVGQARQPSPLDAGVSADRALEPDDDSSGTDKRTSSKDSANTHH